jgi:hypothetical protein
VEVEQVNLDERQRLLLMAAFLHGAKAQAEIRANCGRVLRQALAWAGHWKENQDNREFDDYLNPVIKDWYGDLISMIRDNSESGLLIEGSGNFGSPDDPPFGNPDEKPAAPMFTGCRLTHKGREIAQRLLQAYPQGLA